MTIETQIRRTLMSLAALVGLGSVALVQGDAIEVPAGAVLTANCPEAVAEPLPAVIRAAVDPVRVDWRVRVPATIARSRS